MQREVVVDHYARPKAVNEQPHSIVAIWAEISGLKEAFDYEWIFADWDESRQEVAVSKPPLFDVERLYFSLEDVELLLDKLWWTLPFYFFGIWLWTDGLLSGRKLFILKFFISI